MTEKTEAQPEALRVAAWLINAPFKTTHGDMLVGGRELRRLHAETEAQAARIAELEAQLSARQAAPDGWRLVPAEPTEEMVTAGQESFGVHDCYYAMLSAAPPPPEREPLTDQEILEAVSSLYAHPAARSMGAGDDIATARAIERAHGIGATND